MYSPLLLPLYLLLYIIIIYIINIYYNIYYIVSIVEHSIARAGQQNTKLSSVICHRSDHFTPNFARKALGNASLWIMM